MSQWTHVAGIIRLDGIGACMVMGSTEFKNRAVVEAVTKALGITYDFNSSIDDCSQCNVPAGSEGSLRYRVLPNSEEDTHSLSWGYAVIWGDLRDFGMEDVQKIEDWFQGALEKLQKPEGFKPPEAMTEHEKAEYLLSSFAIRDAVLSIDVEYKSRMILLWNNDTNKVVRLKTKC